MKKLTLSLLALMLILISSLSFGACAKPYVGEYSFSSLTMDMGSITVSMKAGEETFGEIVEADMMTLTVNEDGTAVMTSKLMDEIAETENLTWEKGEDGALIFTSVTEPEEEPVTATYEKGTLTMTMTEEGMTMTVVFVKNSAEKASE